MQPREFPKEPTSIDPATKHEHGRCPAVVGAVTRVLPDPTTELGHRGDHDVGPSIADVVTKCSEPGREITQQGVH